MKPLAARDLAGPAVRPRRAIALAAAPVLAGLVGVAGPAPAALAQTAGTWRGLSADVDPDGTGPLPLTEGFARYNNPANWSTGVVPRNPGDAATFAGLGARSVYLDQSVSLDRIDFRSPQGTFITPAPRAPAGPGDFVPASNASITLTGPATINAVNTPPDRRVPGVFDPVNIIFTPVRGTDGLTKTGDGLLALTAANSFTGGLRINGGRLVTAGPAGLPGDAILGAPGGPVSLDGGGQLVLVSNTTTDRTFNVGFGGGEIVVNPGTTFNHSGFTSGPGPVVVRGAARTLTGETSIGGPLTLRGGTTLDGPGTFRFTPTVRVEGDLSLGPAGAGQVAAVNVDRLNNGGALDLAGVKVNAAVNAQGFSERVGATAIRGTTALTLRTATGSTGAATSAVLNLGQLDRRDRAGLYLGGANLGRDPIFFGGPSAPMGQSTVLVDNAFSLPGTSPPGPDGIRIPWAYANAASPAGGTYGIEDPNLTVVDYRDLNGFVAKPLSAYDSGFTAGPANFPGPDVRLTASAALPGNSTAGTTVNALVLADDATPDGTGITLSRGTIVSAVLRVAGGEVLSAFAGVTATGNRPNTAGNVIDVPLNFDGREAVFNTPAALRVRGGLFNADGLTKNGNQPLYLSDVQGGINGQVTVNGGALVIDADQTQGDNLLGSGFLPTRFYGGTASQAPDGSPLGTPADVTDAPYGTPSAGLEVRFGRRDFGGRGDVSSRSPQAFIYHDLAFDGPGGGFITNAGQPVGPVGQSPNGFLLLGGQVDVAAGSSLTLTRPLGADESGVAFAAGATRMPTVVGQTGRVTGGGALVIEDSQRVVLDATSTYTGGTTLNPGGTRTGGFDPVVEVYRDAAFGTGPVTVDGPAVLRTSPNRPVRLANAIDINDAALNRTALTFESNGALELAGVVDARNAADGSRAFLAFNGPAPVTMSGPVVGDGFIRTGTGRLVLAGDNSFRDALFLGFTGANGVPLPGGTTVVQSDGALGRPTNGVQVVTGNTLDFDGTATVGGLRTGTATDDFGRAPLLVVRGTGVGGGTSGGPNGIGAVRSFGGANAFGGDVLLSRSAGGSSQASVAVLSAADRLDVAGAIGSDAAAPAGLRKIGAGTLSTTRLELSSLNVAAGRVQVASGGPTVRPSQRAASVLQAIPTFGPGGGTPQLDLTNGALLIDVAVPVPGGAIRDLIRAAYAGPAGAWTGAGITTSDGDLTRLGLGYLDGGDLPAGSRSDDDSFAGLDPAAGDVVIALTLFGDADLDGRVTKADFLRLAGAYGRGVAGNPSGGPAGSGLWGGGDFNYDGAVNAADLNLLLGNFGATVGGGFAGVSAADRAFVNAFAAALAATPVPEPAGVAGLLGGATVLLGRRRTARASVGGGGLA